MSQYYPGSGPIGAKLMIVSDCPTEDGHISGSVGRELNRMLVEAGTSLSNCWVTSVSKYMVPPSPRGKKIPFHIRAKNVGIDAQQAAHELQLEINQIVPNCILALGKAALWAMYGKTSIESHRGSILMGMGRKMVPTYHPYGLFNSPDTEFIGYYNKEIIKFDVKRAVKQSKFPEIIRPNRNLAVCRSSHELIEFYNRYKHLGKPAVDIEAGGTCLPICTGLSFTPLHGMTVPLWNHDGISNISDSDLVSIWLILADILASNEIIGQNFKYDQDKLKRLGFKIKRLASDVMLKSFAINPELPVNLAFNTSLYTEEPYYKDEGMYHGKLEDLFIGCARDACVTKEIDGAMDADLDQLSMRPYYENFILQLHELYLDIESNGFLVDNEARNRLMRKYIAWDEEVRYELFKLVGHEINVNSPKQVAELLYNDWHLPAKKGTSEEDITELLNSPRVTSEKHRKSLELILLDRRIRKSISTYMMALPDYDGRMKSTYFICLKTGRTSTGQQDPPIRPTVKIVNEKGEKKERALGIAFQTMTKHGDVGADIREQYVPDKGEVFVNIDSSQAEARVVALLSNDEVTLGLYDTNDIHALTASWFFGGTEADYSKKILGYESPIRFAGKTLRHACHLGAGPKRASIELNTQARKYKIDIRITQSIAERAIKIFHTKSPKVQQVFHAGIIEHLQKFRRLTAPVPYGIDAPHGGTRIFFERWGDDLFREAFSYIPQRAVSDNTKAAALRIKKRIPQIKIILEAHDALLFSIPERYLDDWIPICREEMERPIRFDTCSIPRHDLVIPSDVEIGYNYADLKKWRKKVA